MLTILTHQSPLVDLAHHPVYREQVNSCITSLTLEWNNIGTYEQGIQRLADGLEVNGCLTSLVLCNNHINAQVPTDGFSFFFLPCFPCRPKLTTIGRLNAGVACGIRRRYFSLLGRRSYSPI